MRKKVIGVGTPNLDHIQHVPYEFAKKLHGKEGLEYIDLETFQHLLQTSSSLDIQIVGGSAYNTIRSLQRLGTPSAFLGPIGEDSAGKKIRAEMRFSGIEAHFIPSMLPTGQVLCLVTPDGKRSFKTFLGAGDTFRKADLKAEFFKNISLIHIEGYLFFNHMEVVHALIEMAKKRQILVSIDLGSHNLVKMHREEILKLIKGKVDFVFANELEAFELAHKDPKEACEYIHQFVKTAIILNGKRGCFVSSDEGAIHVRAKDIVAFDSTGAGDLFASGFLHGVLLDKPLLTCAEWGTLLASSIVQIDGASLPKPIYKQILKLLKK